jgi:hypothetical protein
LLAARTPIFMRYLEFHHLFKQFIVISLADIKLVKPDFDHRRLVEWQQKGYLTQLRRGYYIFTDRTKHLNEESLFLIANKIYFPSYVSLETALHYYNFIPEAPFTVTSISSRKTKQFQTPVANFSYSSVKSNLMTGYLLVDIESNERTTASANSNNQSAKLAYPEKAILDYLYLNPKLMSLDDIEALRLNKAEIKSRCNFDRFEQLLTLFNAKTMHNRSKVFLNWLKSKE